QTSVAACGCTGRGGRASFSSWQPCLLILPTGGTAFYGLGVRDGAAAFSASGVASQTFTVWSQLAEARRWPWGLELTLGASQVWPFRERTSWPRWASQTLTVWSELALARRWPSRLKLTLTTHPVCPWSVRTCCPVSASQTLTVWSSLPLARRWPSGLKQTLRT